MTETFKTIERGELAFYFHLEEGIDIPMLLSDGKGKVRWLNKAMEAYTGIEKDAAAGMDYREMLTTYIAPFVEETTAFLKDVFTSIEMGEAIERKVYHLVPIGKPDSWVEFSSTPLTSGILSNGRMDVFRDVTERIRIEEEINQKNELQALIADISSSFLNIGPDELDLRIRDALRTLGEYLGVERCYLTLISEDGKEIEGDYEWCADSTSPCQGLQGVAVFDYSGKGGGRKGREIIHTVNAARKKQSHVIPMKGTTLRGFLGFDGLIREIPAFHHSGHLIRMAGETLISVIERRRVEETLYQHDAICEAVMMASGTFLRSTIWEEMISDVLRLLGEGAGLSRVFIVEDMRDREGAGRIYEWSAPYAKAVPVTNTGNEAFWNSEGMEQWSAALSLGHVIAGNTKDLPVQSQDLFREHEVLSFLLIPIFAGENCWGFIGFEDCAKEREWMKPEIDALKTAADSLGTTIYRNERDREIQHHNQQLSLINEIISAAGSSDTFLDLLRITLHQTVSVLGVKSGAIYLLDQDSDIADLKCTAGIEKDTSFFISSLPRNGMPYHQVFVEGIPLIDEEMNDGQHGGDLPHVSWIPLKAEGTVVGAMALTNRQDRPFSGTEQTILAAAGREIGTAIQKSRLREELSESYEKANLYLDIMSHDIKNANTVSIMYADMLTEKAEGEAKEFADKLMESIRRSIEITDHVTTIRRLHEEVPVLKPIDLNEVIQKEITRHPESKIHYSPSSFLVCADNLISEIFSNLIGNSFKFGGDDISVIIRIEDRYEEVEITVEDTGPGIPDDIKDTIFERFQHGGKNVSGKGLGLYIVRSLIERYGGVVRVTDRVPGHQDQGVAFRFTLKKADEM